MSGGARTRRPPLAALYRIPRLHDDLTRARPSSAWLQGAAALQEAAEAYLVGVFEDAQVGAALWGPLPALQGQLISASSAMPASRTMLPLASRPRCLLQRTFHAGLLQLPVPGPWLDVPQLHSHKPGIATLMPKLTPGFAAAVPQLCAIHARRVTVFVKDIQLARRLRGDLNADYLC